MLVNNQFYMRMFIVQGEKKTNHISAPNGSKALFFGSFFTPEKSFSSNYKDSQLLLTAAAALSQNGQIAV